MESGSKEKNDHFSKRTKEITNELSREFEFLETITTELQVKGRAVKELETSYTRTMTLYDKCLSFKAPMFMVDPYGWVFHHSCLGIAIGNARENPLSEIIKGLCYKELYEMEESEALYKALISNIESVRAELNAYQSINKYLDKG